jgi:uncharacterized membrane protein YdjX (TVP38/TMEM64 family)
MNYTKLMLIGLGVLGIFLHCLVELNKLNKANKGLIQIVIREYFKAEVFSLLIALFVVIGCSIISNEVESILSKLGYEWLLGAAYISIGYSAQSILIFVMGKTAKIISSETDETTSNN